MKINEINEGSNPLFKINKFLDDKKKREEYARKLQQQRDAEKDKEKVDEKGLPQKYNPDGETYRGTANKIPNSKSVKKSDITVRGKQVDFPDDSYDATQVSDVEKTDLEQHVKELISTLGKREAMVLKAYFGFEPFEKSYSVNQIGKAMNLSPQRISQILKLARRKLLSRQHSSGKLKSYMYDSVNEDLGSIPPLTDLIIMAVVGQTTVAALKAAYKTGKYALKLKKLADRAGVKLNNAVMGESNPFTDARMNAIKAGKKEFTVNGKKYRVTGDTSDEEEAIANEAINRDEYTATLAAKQQDKFFAAALAALDRLVKSDPRGQDVGGYAFDIARAFQGVNGRELAAAYSANK
jgi:RNA polymerase sigma factor (sigma-70 family)